MKYNRGTEYLFDEEYPDDPIAPGYVRVYEFLHGYEDHLIEKIETPNPLSKILAEEIQREIDREIIKAVYEKVKV